MIEMVTAADVAQRVWASTAPALAGAPWVRTGRWVKGRFVYRDRDEIALTEVLPSHAAAVPVYGADGRCQALFFDLDAGRGGRNLVAAQTASLQKLFSRLGFKSFTDFSPNGGKHIYLLLTERLEYVVARELVEAVAHRFSTVDPGPHQNLSKGCCRTPGAVHKRGGYQRLETPWLEVLKAIAEPNSTQGVVGALRAEFAVEISELNARDVAAASSNEDITQSTGAIAADPDVEPDNATTGSRISRRIQTLARTGDYLAAGYNSPSDGCFAVLLAYVGAGYSLTYLMRRLAQGTLPGLALMYGDKQHRRLGKDYDAAVATHRRNNRKTQGVRSVHEKDTSKPKTQKGLVKPQNLLIRTWATGILNKETIAFAGQGLVIRLVARAIAAAAHMTGSLEIEFGCRNIALDTGHGHNAVAIALRSLASLGWLEKTGDARDPARRFRNADRYRLTIPDDYAEEAGKWRWHPGKIHALRPAFTALGIPAALVFEAIEMRRATETAALMAVTGLSRSTVYAATRLLLAYNLISRDGTGFVAHPERLTRVAEELGCDEARAARIDRIRQQRTIWHTWLDNWFTRKTHHTAFSADYDEPPPWPDEAPWLEESNEYTN